MKINIKKNILFVFVTIVLFAFGGCGTNNNIVFKFGLVLTPLVIFIIFAFYIPWWRFIGLI